MITRFWAALARSVADPDAATGKAWALDASSAGKAGQHDAPPEFGLSDVLQQPKFLTRKVLAAAEIPGDERYHFYPAGRIRAPPTMYFWAHHSWGLARRLSAAYDASLPEQHTYDAYVSLKLEGPAYVPGSTKENRFSIDRILLVEVE